MHPFSGATGPIAFECRAVDHIGFSPFAPIAGDWNRDGQLDLAVSEAGENAISVFLNRGHGRFERDGSVRVGRIPRGMAAGDINGDGNLDLVVGNAESNDVAVTLGDGHGKFSKIGSYRTGIAPFTAELADLDGDGKLDLIIVNETDTVYTPVGTVSVLYGDGTGMFGAPVDLKAGRNPTAVVVADIDGEHGPDLVVSNWRSNTLSIFLNGGDRTFHKTEELEFGGEFPYSMALADFDRDGKADIAVTDLGAGAVWVRYGDGMGRFPRVARFPVEAGVRSVVAADLNGDGIMDLATANTGAGTVSVLIGVPGGFAPAMNIPVGTGPRTVIAADLDNDGKLDLAVTDQTAAALLLLFQRSSPGAPCPGVGSKK